MPWYSEEELSQFEIAVRFDQPDAGENQTIEAHNAAVMALYGIAIVSLADVLVETANDEQWDELAFRFNNMLSPLFSVVDEVRVGHPADELLILTRKALANNIYLQSPNYKIRFRSGSLLFTVAALGIPALIAVPSVLLKLAKVYEIKVNADKTKADTMKAIADVRRMELFMPQEAEELLIRGDRMLAETEEIRARTKKLQAETKHILNETASKSLGANNDTPLKFVNATYDFRDAELTLEEEAFVKQQEQLALAYKQLFEEAMESVRNQSEVIRVLAQALSEEPMEVRNLKISRKLTKRNVMRLQAGEHVQELSERKPGSE